MGDLALVNLYLEDWIVNESLEYVVYLKYMNRGFRRRSGVITVKIAVAFDTTIWLIIGHNKDEKIYYIINRGVDGCKAYYESQELGPIGDPDFFKGLDSVLELYLSLSRMSKGEFASWASGGKSCV